MSESWEASDESVWGVIVEPLPANQADGLFIDWKRDNADVASSQEPNDVLRDVVRGNEGDLIRYRVSLPVDKGRARGRDI